MTPQQPSDPPARRLSEIDSTRVLRRAVEIDAQRGATLDLEDLRQIASEAGISRSAIDSAIEEVRLGVVPDELPLEAPPAAPTGLDAVLDKFGTSAKTLRNWWRTTSIAIAGFGLGFAAPLLEGGRFIRWGRDQIWVNGTGESWTILAAIIAGLIGLTAIRRHRRSRTQWDFQMDILWLWLAFGTGWMLAHGRFDDEPFAAVLGAWTSFATVGGLLVDRTWTRFRGWVRSVADSRNHPEHA